MLQFNQRETGSKRIVIMGCGGLGASVATTLSNQGHTVHMLDSHPESFSRLPPDDVEAGHIVPIIGEGTLQNDLAKASIQEADAFMALSEVDTQNALASQMAKHILNVPRVVCRIDDPVMQEMYSKLDIMAISATTLVAQVALEAVAG